MHQNTPNYNSNIHFGPLGWVGPWRVNNWTIDYVHIFPALQGLTVKQGASKSENGKRKLLYFSGHDTDCLKIFKGRCWWTKDWSSRCHKVIEDYERMWVSVTTHTAKGHRWVPSWLTSKLHWTIMKTKTSTECKYVMSENIDLRKIGPEWKHVQSENMCWVNTWAEWKYMLSENISRMKICAE